MLLEVMRFYRKARTLLAEPVPGGERPLPGTTLPWTTLQASRS